MKRFLLFYGVNYYPQGGMNDFGGSFDTIEEALEKATLYTLIDWWQIVDHQTMSIIKEGHRS